uniref:Secreted protein n=1 Tax=Anguilla anguilla TaxID=7936 RepID=A0A0E9UXB8_ANGAN
MCMCVHVCACVCVRGCVCVFLRVESIGRDDCPCHEPAPLSVRLSVCLSVCLYVFVSSVCLPG